MRDEVGRHTGVVTSNTGSSASTEAGSPGEGMLQPTRGVGWGNWAGQGCEGGKFASEEVTYCLFSVGSRGTAICVDGHPGLAHHEASGLLLGASRCWCLSALWFSACQGAKGCLLKTPQSWMGTFEAVLAPLLACMQVPEVRHEGWNNPAGKGTPQGQSEAQEV